MTEHHKSIPDSPPVSERGPPMRVPALRDTPLTPRQEKFVQALARGLDITAAQLDAGYKSRRAVMHTLGMPNVAARLNALRAKTLADNEVSIDEIVGELREIIARMRSGATVAELNLARRSLMDLARICGLFSDRGPAPLPAHGITTIRRVLVYPNGREEEY